jgi:methylglutaconyl-CoA hydratase
MKTIQIIRSETGAVTIQMSRPEVLNAFDELMIGELDEAIAALAEDPAARVLVLAGAGKAFSAGADLNWMRRASEATRDWNLADARRFAGMLHKLQSCPKPTIARVQGLALGGGVGLVAACDIAIAADGARFAVSEARFGILPSVIGPYLINAVGKRHAQALALTARRIEAEEAWGLGLIHKVVPEAELDEAVAATAGELLRNGPGALAEIKGLFAQLSVGPITPEIRELTAQTISRVRGTDEAREGFAAFLAKRPAAWVRK